jgi:hypothetical protein
MVDNPFFPLSFISAPAILMNACAIMQNGTNLRYGLAITQLRDFRNSIASNDDRITSLYTDPAEVVNLAKKRVQLLLRSLNFLYAAVGMFGTTTFIGLFGAFLIKADTQLVSKVTTVMVATAGIGIIFLLSAVVTFIQESAIAKSMLKLHLHTTDI